MSAFAHAPEVMFYAPAKYAALATVSVGIIGASQSDSSRKKKNEFKQIVLINTLTFHSKNQSPFSNATTELQQSL